MTVEMLHIRISSYKIYKHSSSRTHSVKRSSAKQSEGLKRPLLQVIALDAGNQDIWYGNVIVIYTARCVIIGTILTRPASARVTRHQQGGPGVIQVAGIRPQEEARRSQQIKRVPGHWQHLQVLKNMRNQSMIIKVNQNLSTTKRKLVAGLSGIII